MYKVIISATLAVACLALGCGRDRPDPVAGSDGGGVPTDGGALRSTDATVQTDASVQTDAGRVEHPLAVWLGHWSQPAGEWRWSCTSAWGGTNSGRTWEEGDRRYWDIEALDERRIRVVQDGGYTWNYVIAGNVGTLEEGSFSHGVLVDEPGAEVHLIRETVTLQGDGSILNDVHYELTSAGGESCTEDQTIVLTR